MCEPVTLAALSIASTAAGTYATAAHGRAQQRSINTQRAAQSEEIRAQAQQAMGKRVKQGRAERARLRVAAGESRIAGQSFEAQLMNSLFQEDFDLADVQQQTLFNERASRTSADMASSRIEGPNLALAGLQIGGAVYRYRHPETE